MGLTSLLTWLLVTVSGFGAQPAVGGGGPITRPHSQVGAAPAVGGGGPITRKAASSVKAGPAVGGGGPITR